MSVRVEMTGHGRRSPVGLVPTDLGGGTHYQSCRSGALTSWSYGPTRIGDRGSALGIPKGFHALFPFIFSVLGSRRQAPRRRLRLRRGRGTAARRRGAYAG